MVKIIREKKVTNKRACLQKKEEVILKAELLFCIIILDGFYTCILYEV